MKSFQAMAYFISLVAVLVSLIAFSVTRHHVYLYMGLGSVILIAIYTGYFRRRIRKQFNILVRFLEIRILNKVFKHVTSVLVFYLL
jgi:hypothetical protein